MTRRRTTTFIPRLTKEQQIGWLEIIIYGAGIFGTVFAQAQPPTWITSSVTFIGLCASFKLIRMMGYKTPLTKAAPADTQPAAEYGAGEDV